MPIIGWSKDGFVGVPDVLRILEEAFGGKNVRATPTGRNINLSEFLMSRPGLVVWPDFWNNIGPAIQDRQVTVKEAQKTGLDSYDPKSSVRASKVLNKAVFVFPDPSLFCARIAIAIDRQWNGEDGDLLANGNKTLCYVIGAKGSMVEVHIMRDTKSHYWELSAYDQILDDFVWPSWVRFLSPSKHEKYELVWEEVNMGNPLDSYKYLKQCRPKLL
jgi:hypothetical protein